MNYTVKQDEQKNYVLFINGVEAICPYKNDTVMPVQNALGQTQFSVLRTPCSTICPFADYVKSANIHQYSIECTGIFKSFEIEETEEESLNRQNIIKL
jgi:hypothetical protein